MEILNALCGLSNIMDKKNNKDDQTVIQKHFIINGYEFQLNFIYQSIVINIWHGNNYDVFVFKFENGKYGDREIEEIKKMKSSIHLPPNLIIQELNKIGVKEL